MNRVAGSLIVFVWALCGPLEGADWPQYRFDAGRSGASPASLPESLHLLWERHLPPPQPVFPGQDQICYDKSYEPVVMGQMLFVPSMVTHSLTALNTRTGERVWQFFAEGPVRLAPVAWQDKVYIVSDDGYLYCLNASDGKLRWKYRGLPVGRRDRKLMGDGSLVSATPARGGPVLADGIIYFGAGLWADDGVFVHAVDATTGKTVWSNTTSGHIERANADHGVAGVAGISPQGHLAIVNDILIVPCGSQLPALMDRKTGKLHTYTMGWGGKYQQPKGCVFVSGIGKYLMHGGDLYDISDAGEQPSLNSTDIEFDKYRMVHVGGLTRLQVDRTNLKKQPLGDFRNPALTAEAMYYHQDGIVAVDFTKPTIRSNKQTKRFVDLESVVFPELWRLDSKSKVHIKARQRLYCTAPSAVEAIEIPRSGEKPHVSWRANVEGTPHRLLAADDKLFVVTLEGRIYAFGPNQPKSPLVHEAPMRRKLVPSSKTTRALAILEAAQITEGYVLIVDFAEPQEAVEIVQNSNCEVIAFQQDPMKAREIRVLLEKAGLYGSRVTVIVGDPVSIAIAPYLANLILIDSERAENLAYVQSLYPHLRPHGGVIGLPTLPGSRQSLDKRISQGHLPGAKLVSAGNDTLLTRPGPLGDSADWSHSDANAAGTEASKDRIVKPPFTRLWFDGRFRWDKGRGSTEVRIAGGRLFVGGNNLYALDAFTGRHLWTIESQAREEKLVAMHDAIFLVEGGTCTVRDPATGKPLKQLNFPGVRRANWSSMRVTDKFVVAGSGEALACIDRETGRTIWQQECDNPIQSIAIGGGKVFCSDAVNQRRKGLKPGEPAGSTTAIDLRTGKVLWKIPATGDIHYSSTHDLLVVGSQLPRDAIQVPNFNSVYPLKSFSAYRASDGKPLWSNIQATHVYIVNDKLYSYVTQQIPKQAWVRNHDPKTGEQLGEDLKWWQRGCTPPRAGSSLLTTRYLGNAAFYDLAEEKMTPINHVRAACSNNLFLGNGLLVAPNLSDGCVCNYIPISQGFAPSQVVK